MKARKKTIGNKVHISFLLAVTFVLFVFVMLVGGDSVDAQGNNFKKYRADFACGLNPAATDRVRPGEYTTSIFILNTNSNTVDVSLIMSLTFPPNALPGMGDFTPGEVVDLGSFPLAPNQAFNVDCEELLAGFGTLELLQPPPYILGVLTVESMKKINVSAIYTSSDLAGGSVSIDREKIERSKD